MSKHICVVGAGIGGLSAAIRLAKAGHSVTVFDQLDRPGGKMGEVIADTPLGRFRFDTGPSVITLRPVFERLWRDAGCDLAEDVTLLPLAPITRYFWPDGLTLDADADEAVMLERIRAFAPRDVDGYRRFMRYVAGLHDVVGGPFLYRAQPGLRDLLRLPLGDVFRIDALRSMSAAIRGYVRDPHLIQLLERFATYNGSSPYQAPATLNVIAHVEMALGAWYPKGGVFTLARAFERLALRLGVEVRYGARVAEIETRAGRAIGLRLASGEVAPADAVVCNADITAARRELLPGAGRLPGLEPSCSGFALLLGAPVESPRLAHHNIFFSRDYRAEFDAIFRRRVPPEDPTLYACITSKTDPGHAPAGAENWFVLVNAPYVSMAFDWAREGGDYAALVLDQLRARVPGAARLSPVFEQRLTPATLDALYGGNRGAIYGFSSNTRVAAFARPGNRARDIRGLYFAGGSVHPGGGVPLVALSGIAAAQCVAEDLDSL